MPLSGAVRCGRAAIDGGGQPRSGAEVAELDALELAGWPAGTRAICRREDPHPGAQLCFTDADGHRFQVFLTDQPDPDMTALELRHRRRARVEDRIRCGKATGLRNLPFDLWRRNQVWLELVLVAQDLLGWAQVLLLDGDLKLAEPKTLRYRLLHVPARVIRHARRVIVRLQRTWPWPAALAAAFARLRALPLRADATPDRAVPSRQAGPAGMLAQRQRRVTSRPSVAATTTPAPNPGAEGGQHRNRPSGAPSTGATSAS